LKLSAGTFLKPRRLEVLVVEEDAWGISSGYRIPVVQMPSRPADTERPARTDAVEKPALRRRSVLLLTRRLAAAGVVMGIDLVGPHRTERFALLLNGSPAAKK
jgi:hypothetical protein